MVILFVLLTLLIWAIIFRFRRRRLYKLASLIPGADNELPIIGVSHNFIGSSQDILTTLRNYSYIAMKHGVMKGWLNHYLYVVTVNPNDIEVILKTSLEKDELLRFVRDVIGSGASIFAPVSIWRRRRKISVPAFKPKNIEQFKEILSEQSNVLSKKLNMYADAGEFDIWLDLTAYTLDAICEAVLGVKIQAQSNSGHGFLMSLNHVLHVACERMFHLWLQPEWCFKLSSHYSKYKKSRKTLNDFVDEIIQNKRTELKETQQHPKETENISEHENCKRESFLDLLISLSGGSSGYTDVELREELLTLIIAGTDTSAVAIGFTLKLLAKYPRIQEKVYQELFDVFGQSDRALLKDDLKKLTYLEMVIKESLRLYPPVPFIIRKIETETKLPSGVIVPANSGVVVSIWGVHRYAKYWGPNSEHFDPERFYPERVESQHPCSYIAFSSGPRNCLGYQYALMSIKSALVSILRCYKILGEEEAGPVPNIPVKFEIMMKAVDGYKIKIERRKKIET